MLTPGHYLQIYLAVSNLFYCSLTANKETAFIHAISTAAIIYEIITQCRLNKIPGCGCADVKKQREGNGDWQWGGCSDNIRFGEKETRHFINRLETGIDARTAFNLHNNEVGRKVHLSSSNCLTIRKGGSRGRVQGVRTSPPPWDDLRFSNTTGILQKKKLCGLLVLK